MLMPFSMALLPSRTPCACDPVTLVAAFFLRFSETARPGPGHGEAVRHGRPVGATAVGAGRDADDVAEGAAEGAEAVEPHVEAHVGDAALGVSQEEHGALDATPLQVAVRSEERRVGKEQRAR